MYLNNTAIEQALIPQTEVSKALGRSRSGLEKLRKQDATFPKPIKLGESRQASVYFVIAEINEWLASKINERDTLTFNASPANQAGQQL